MTTEPADGQRNGDGDMLMIPSQLARMVDAREWVAARASAAGLDDRSLWALELAVTEALSNVIRHGYGDREDREVHLRLTVDDDKVTVIVRGFGRSFDRAAYHPEDRDPGRPGGYGVPLIEKLMDEVEWDDSPAEGTRLRLTKYRAGRGGEMVDG